MNKKIYLWLIVSFMCFQIYGQEKTIKGTVYDDSTSEGLPFASLIYKGTTIGGSTDMNGVFSIPMPEKESILQISYLGYTTQEIRILPNHSQKLTIRLKPDGIALQEITVKPGKEHYTRKNNPAVRFVKRMIELRESNNPRDKEYYQYDQYEKILIGLNDFGQKPKKNGEKGKFEFLNEFVDTLENGATILPYWKRKK